VAWLDLAKEPYVLHVPDEYGRYYLMPILSAWTNVFADPGTPDDRHHSGQFPPSPDQTGTAPCRRASSNSKRPPTWSGSWADLLHGHAGGLQDRSYLQDMYSLRPLSAWKKPYAPPVKMPVDHLLDMKTPPREQVGGDEAGEFFNTLACLL